MTDAAIRQSLGQTIDPQQLSRLARQMASAIGDGTPASWAGFVWYRPRRELQQPLGRPTEQRHPARAA
ncbi:MAG: hypothetical protein JOZ41_07475 [Chloroflexi bacterium]|nr:hypothetical protein [Chloroflexota bacterium]